MPKTRILIADDHAIVRAGLRLLLEDQADMEVVGEARDGSEGVELVAALNPDVVLMDVAMPGMDGIVATKRINEVAPGTRVLGLSMHEDERYFFRMLRAGACGYVIKGAAPEELLAAIRSVAMDQAYLYPSLARKLLDDYVRQAKAGQEKDSYDALSDREREVLQLIAEGRTSGQIAETMHLSINTVERHRSNLMSKLDLHDRVELVKYAIRKGLIEA